MARCPQCSNEAPDGSRFCPSCAAALHASSVPTETSLGTELPARAAPSRERARFVPGAVLDKRYRIIALVGRGGMGDVYRADDLKLGQPVRISGTSCIVVEGASRLGVR